MRKTLLKAVLPLVFLGVFGVGWYAWHREGPDERVTQFHTSMYYLNNQDFFASSLKPFASTTPLFPRPRVFITNQHVLAASLIAYQFALAQDPSVQHVVLITQNNWNAGQGAVITSMSNWKTPLGESQLDVPFTKDLVEKKLAVVDESIFASEHGITGIIPYVVNAFPNAKVTVLVIRDKTPDRIVDALAAELTSKQDANTVVIGTIDMSHYLPKYLSDVHDAKTISSITHFDYDTLPRLDIDTAPTLRTILKLAESRGEEIFAVTAHANSADITSEPDLLSTTSYITGYFKKGERASSVDPISLLFTGDVMLDRYVALHAKEKGDSSLFSQIERMFLGTDAVVANLEGTITTQPSVSVADPTILRFTFNPRFASFLSNLGVTAVSLSNNHTHDFGEEGLTQTKKYVGAAGVTFFGSPDNSSDRSATLVVRGKKICLVGYEAFVSPDITSTVHEIQTLRPVCDVVMATMHAGVEYNASFTSGQQVIAHAFIDAGADAVIGTHPHVVEPLEIYKGKAIFYSLGNFIFDQRFSYETMQGLAVQVDIKNTEFTYTLVPVTITNEEVSFASPIDRVKTLSRLIDSNLSKDIASSILNTYSFTLK